MKTATDPFDACYCWKGPDFTFYAAIEPRLMWVVKGTKGVWRGFYARGDFIDILRDLDDQWDSMEDEEMLRATEDIKDEDKADSICEKIQNKYEKNWKAIYKRNHLADLEEYSLDNKYKKMKKNVAKRIFRKVIDYRE